MGRVSGGMQINKQPGGQKPLFANYMDVNPSTNLKKNIELQGEDSFEKEYIEFVDLAAHELDAPLRKLNILISRLVDKYDIASQDKDAKSYAERIEHCLKDMRLLINDMSALAKTASGIKEYNLCKLDGIVKQVLKDVSSTIQSRKVVIHLTSLPVLKGDAVQYRQLFQNVLENALKFRKAGIPPEIHIRSVMLAKEEKDRLGLAEDKKYHKIEVADNGIGFKNEHAEKIFRPFVRLHGKSQFPGTGIGLAVCRKIVENLGGIIYAEGQENQGASFVIILPETR